MIYYLNLFLLNLLNLFDYPFFVLYFMNFYEDDLNVIIKVIFLFFMVTFFLMRR